MLQLAPVSPTMERSTMGGTDNIMGEFIVDDNITTNGFTIGDKHITGGIAMDNMYITMDVSIVYTKDDNNITVGRLSMDENNIYSGSPVP